ncbi:MAG: hypothetical protein MPW14_15525 [Candidatus Manganitrophus sp.]|nr:MAG: hypothetical protein MPW14_15525 [Candidatus Manganitrophus sp.]
MPIQIFNWVSRPQRGFSSNAAAGILVLLLMTFVMNGMAVYLRHRYAKTDQVVIAPMDAAIHVQKP